MIDQLNDLLVKHGFEPTAERDVLPTSQWRPAPVDLGRYVAYITDQEAYGDFTLEAMVAVSDSGEVAMGGFDNGCSVSYFCVTPTVVALLQDMVETFSKAV